MTETLSNSMMRLASLHFESLGGPVAAKAVALLGSKDWQGLARMSVDPRSYTDPLHYMRDNSVCALLKKFKDFPGDVDALTQAAKQKWWQGERDCFRSNERLARYLPEHRNSDDRVGGISDFLSEVRKLIVDWIGPRPPDIVSGRHGPGATYSNRGRKTTVPDKMSSDPSLTPGAIWFLPQWLGTQWGASFAQRQGKFIWSRGNRYSTAEKDAKERRSIGTECSINVFYQLAYGKAMRRRLRNNTGWDLDHAQDIHRRVARESSVHGEFATLDLSNASDTVCRVLVKLLLPHAWFDVLDDLRSKFTHIDNRWVQLEKFSSMGNGFTFELETIIFAALTCVAVRKGGGVGRLGADVFVFGDDIIMPTVRFAEVDPVLRFFGFTLNEEKSFFGSEPFRESCGGDYFNGKSVRGAYIKADPQGPEDYIVIANKLFELREKFSDLGHELQMKPWFHTLDQLPTPVRHCRGPKALGDTVIWDKDESKWTTRTRHGIRYFRCHRPWKMRVTPFSVFDGSVVLACATYGVENHGTPHRGFARREGVIPRDAVLSYKVGWVPYS